MWYVWPLEKTLLGVASTMRSIGLSTGTCNDRKRIRMKTHSHHSRKKSHINIYKQYAISTCANVFIALTTWLVYINLVWLTVSYITYILLSKCQLILVPVGIHLYRKCLFCPALSAPHIYTLPQIQRAPKLQLSC